MKRFIPIFVILTVMLSCFSLTLSVSAEKSDNIKSGTCGNDLTWTLDLDTGELAISGTGKMDNYYREGYYGNTPWDSYRYKIKTISIDKRITSIGDYAFYGCGSLKSIGIPDNITSIGAYAFFSCNNLTNITMGNNVASIGNSSFWGCNSLMEVSLPSNINSVGDSAFRDCSNLTRVTIGDNVTSIGNFAFDYCYKLIEVYNLSSLNITKGDTNNGSVGYFALNVYTPASGQSKLHTSPDGFIFYEDGDICYLMGYTGIQNVITLPTSCNCKNYSIYKYAFYNCNKLISITIPDSVTSIGNFAFDGCHKLIEIYNLSSLSITKGTMDNGKVGYYALNIYEPTGGKSKLHTTSDGFVFYEDDNTCYLMGYTETQISITLPTSRNSKDYEIYEYALYGCNNLTNVIIPNSVTSIGNSAFGSCDNLVNVYIGDSVVSIDRAFSDCNNLTNVVIGKSVTSIDDGAFSYCCIRNVYIDSNTVASMLTSPSACGFLLNNAETILFEKNVTNITDFVKNNFEFKGISYENGMEYSVYSKVNYELKSFPNENNSPSNDITHNVINGNNPQIAEKFDDMVVSVGGCRSSVIGGVALMSVTVLGTALVIKKKD